MRIETDNFVINSDSNKNIWIEQRCLGKTKDGEKKEYTKRVTGYFHSFADALKDFSEKAIYGDDSSDVKSLLRNLKDVEEKMTQLVGEYSCYLMKQQNCL